MTATKRETIARAVFEARWPGHWNDHDFLLQQDQAYDEADAVLRALDEAGLVVVPKEASPAMIDAGGREVLIDWHCVWASEKCETRFAADSIPDIYRAMIAAAVEGEPK